MLGFNGGTIGIANTVFTGTKSNDPNYSNVSLLLNGNETSGSDPNYSSVSLLLNGNGTNGSTTFTDSSSYGHTVTPSGNAQISTTQSKFGGASMYFDGSGDYLSIPDDTSLHLGSDNFTFEFWTYLNSTNGHFINKRVSTSANVQYLYFTISGGTLYLYATSNGSSWNIASNFNFGNTTLSTGQWYHIALVRNGTEIATYVNGIKSPNTITTSAAIHNGSTNPLRIVGDVPYGNYLNGYIDDFRLTQGIARYTSNFTPPTAQLPGNTITDSSSNSHTVTPVGNARISTTQSKFGGASMYFDGNGDYLSLANSTDFDCGTGDWTIEAFVYHSSVGPWYPVIISNQVGSWSAGAIALTAHNQTSSPNKFAFAVYDIDSGNPALSASTTHSTNVWHHIAVVRNGTTLTMYRNGESVASRTISSSVSFNFGNNGLCIGGGNWDGSNSYLDGYIDDLRITKGVARYTSNFTPPTAQLPGGETGTFASGLWTSSDHIKQIRNELWPGANFYTYTLGGLSGKFFNGDWRSTISTGNIGTLPLTTTNESSNVTGSGGMPSADHRYGINLWDYITYTTIGESYGFIAIGYFKPPTTGTYTFYTSSDDYSGVWIGSDALPGATRTTSNAVVNNGMGGSSGQANTKRSGTISLTANTYYPIRIVHEEIQGGDNLTFSWAGPGISETTDLTQYFYSISLGGTLTGNYYGL